ncbi:VanZ family protein [Rhodoferax sp.]|uniref:VanZ family protein n=1 Tax=Rhodoferax sp. TaxID=50421 RepID=UPI0026231082|nr:VanZ family protein [Rhodoferax sp.]MDD4943130.1 VanZ family protein [Rhodoferax sp.]MDD5479018.1 VanZ family protein [Rhodoferax sp.]
MPTHKTSAWPLAWVCLGLILYASLYPFAPWRDQGIAPWFFLTAPLLTYWTGFDVVSNVLGYMPFGFFLALAALRSGRSAVALPMALLACAGLSLSMETLQVYLPGRVPSNLDLLLNIGGGALGAASAWSLERLGVLLRWSRFRAHWFVADARGGLVLLALWPVALLFPTVVPFGLGQVLERLEAALAQWLVNSPLQEWLPLREVELQPMLPAVEWSAVLLGLWIPCLLGYCIIGAWLKRVRFVVLLVGVGVASTALSNALSYGPAYAWLWLTTPVKAAMVCVAVLAAALLWLPRRASAALALLALGLDLSLINQTPMGSYVAQTLFSWEQGQFIRFYGLAQWLGWLWPFAATVYVLNVLWDRAPES